MFMSMLSLTKLPRMVTGVSPIQPFVFTGGGANKARMFLPDNYFFPSLIFVGKAVGKVLRY
jgi:hypothetical protein